MSTIGSLLALMDPGITPYNQQELTANRIQSGKTSNATELIQLEALRRAQQTATDVRQAYQQDPSLLLGGGGPQSTLSSLGPGGGPMTQQAFGPGGLGQPQPVPGGQDLSRFAGGTPPGGPQSTLGSLQPQGPPAQQSRLEALMRLNPDAALQVMQQKFTLQEQQLGWGEKMAASIGRIAQGVGDQARLDQARDDIRQIDPKAAAQLPQFYSKEAMEPFIQRALSVHQAQTLKIQDLAAQADAVKAQAALLKQQQAGANIPNYTGDANLDAAIYERMKAQPPGTMPPPYVVAAARKDVQEGKVVVSERQGAAASQSRAVGETAQKRLEAYDKTGMAGQDMHTVLDEAERLMGQGVYGNSLTDQATMAGYRRGLFQDDVKAQRTARLQELGSQLVLAHGSLGSGVSTKDADIYAKAAGNFQQAKNLEEMKQSITSMRTIGNAAIRNANAARKSYEETGRLPAFAERGGGQAPAGARGQGPATFDTADFATWRQGTGTTGNPTAADVQAYFEAKGLKKR